MNTHSNTKLLAVPIGYIKRKNNKINLSLKYPISYIDLIKMEIVFPRQQSLWAIYGLLLKVINEPRHDKTNKISVRPAKTQIWASESSLCAQWVAKDPRFLHADSEDSNQTGRMPMLIWVFAGRTCHFVVCHVVANLCYTVMEIPEISIQ